MTWWAWLLILLPVCILLAVLPLLIVAVVATWWWIWRRPEQGTVLRTMRPPAAAAEDREPPEPEDVAEPPCDDLTQVEGIGPRISSVLMQAGIQTYTRLAEASAPELALILKQSGVRIGDPSTWPEQAGLAAAGQWDALRDLQSTLKGGRRV